MKAIRPEGWAFDITAFSKGGGLCEAHKIEYVGSFGQETKTVLANEENMTEELAELHAIIQAIHYERSQK